MIINPAMKTPKVKRNRYSIYNSSSLSRQIKTRRLMKIKITATVMTDIEQSIRMDCFAVSKF